MAQQQQEKARVWRRVGLKAGNVTFDGKLLATKWVRMTAEHEDGLYKYQKGQALEMPDKRKMMSYLEDGLCVPCDPESGTVNVSVERGLYVFNDSLVTGNSDYVKGGRYELPRSVGDKYCKRGLCDLVEELEPITRGKRVEKAVTR